MIAELGNTKHELKTWPEFFRAVIEGRKTAELRRDDREFREGDLLWLREWDNDERAYTGREASALVTHIVRGTEHLADGFVLLSFGRVAVWYSDCEIVRVTAARDAALARAEAAEHQLAAWGCADHNKHNEDECPLCCAELPEDFGCHAWRKREEGR